MTRRARPICALIAAAVWPGVSAAAPVVSPWPAEGPNDCVAAGASALAGVYAVADAFEDSVEIRGVRGDLRRTITRSEIQALAPWLSLDSGPDGPCAVAVSDSGRLVFIVVQDDTAGPDGLGSDAILRYDTYTAALTLFASADIHADSGVLPRLSAAHFAGRLHVGTSDGRVLTYRAERNTAAGVLLGTALLTGPAVGPVSGLAVDRDTRTLLAMSGATLFSASLGGGNPVFTPRGAIADARAIAWSAQFGMPGQEGLFVLTQPATPPDADARILRVTPAMLSGSAALTPLLYATLPGQANDLAATACGRLLVARDEDAALVSDNADFRLGFDAWLADEFARVVAFARGLVAPDGEPSGWVIDAEVAPGRTRFHPATPDAACWTVLLLAMNDHVFGDPAAASEIAQILRRYAALEPDGFRPGVSGDGIFHHYSDPFSTTGASKPGWSDEYATLSTMKIVLAAARARQAYPDDPAIRVAADRILTRVQNWNAYIAPTTDAVYLQSAGTQPNFGSASRPFNEAMVFVEQADAFGTSYARNAYTRWLDRARHPTATFLSGQPVTGDVAGGFQSAFVSLYPLLVVDEYAASPAWRTHINNLAASFAGWTDDAGPRHFTVFSAGTTKPEWGGYHADSLGDHPGNVTSFPSLMAFAAEGRTSEAVAAYHGYRRGARQPFASGTSILNRRSDIDRGWSPPDAGLPDVALGALGLAELILPGSVEAVLRGPYDAPCRTDLNGDGLADFGDVAQFVTAFAAQDPLADLNGDGLADFGDVGSFVSTFGSGCD